MLRPQAKPDAPLHTYECQYFLPDDPQRWHYYCAAPHLYAALDLLLEQEPKAEMAYITSVD